MKRNLGSVLALYPTPAVVVGTFVQEKVNWVLVAHVGIIGHNRLSVNIVDESFLPTADYVGCVSGAKTDKSGVFAFHLSETGAPIIENSPLVMDCEVLDNYETDTFDNFICSISATYAEESVIDENGKIDYCKLKPILFEMPTYSYLRTGEVIGKCMSLGKSLKIENNKNKEE